MRYLIIGTRLTRLPMGSSNGWDPGSQFVDNSTSARVRHALLIRTLRAGFCGYATLARFFVLVKIEISVQRAPSVVAAVAHSHGCGYPYRGNRHLFLAAGLADQASAGPAIVLVPSGLRLGVGRARPSEETGAASAGRE